ATPRRDLRAPPPGAGAADGPDRAGHLGYDAAARCRRDRGVPSPLHDDARRGEAELEDHHVVHARRLSRGPPDARRVPAPDDQRAPASRMSGGPLAGRTALVTGASRGIGRSVALRLGEAGARVWGLGRSEAALREVAALTGGSSV